jgi:hypothetical protein
MSWVQFTDDLGKRWEVNQIRLYMLIREYLHESMVHNRAKVKREKKWIGPDLVTVEVDWNGFRAQKDARAPEIYDQMSRMMLRDAELAFNQLIDAREKTKMHSDEFTRMQRQASRETMGNIEKSVGRGEAGLEVATFVRDMSATTLVVGAGFMSGGAAFAALGGGSLLKGTGTYQDTGNVGAAIIDGSTTFVVGAIGIGVAGKTASANSAGLRSVTQPSSTMKQAVVKNAKDNGVVIIVGAKINAMGEGIKGHMQGEDVEESLKMAARRFGTDIASGFAGGPVIDNMAMPVVVKLTAGVGVNKAGDMLVAPAQVQQQLAQAPNNVKALFDAATAGPTGKEYIEQNVLRRL